MNALSVEDDSEFGEVRGHQAYTAHGKISDGDDAGAAARVQFDVHGLRPHPRVQIHDQ